MIDAQGTAAYTGIFTIEIVLAVIGAFCLFMLLRTVKKHFGTTEATEAEETAE